MYFLSLLIRNQRHHKVRLKSSLIYQNPDRFVVEKSNAKVLLFNLELRQNKLVFNGGFEHDTCFDIIDISLLDKQLIVCLIPTIDTSIQSFSSTKLAPQIEIKNQSDSSFEIWFDSNFSKEIEVVFKLNDNGKHFEDSIQFCFASKQQIYDVAIDFGSEASQITFHNRADGRVLERMKIVDTLTESFYSHLTNESLLQKDERDNELIKSLFLLKKDDVFFQLHTKPYQFGESEFLNLLTSKNRKDEFKQGYFPISNMKLAHLGAYCFDVRFHSEDDNFFKASQRRFNTTIAPLQQVVINYFIHAILYYISKEHPKNEPLYLVVRLLVPNVFEQERVSKIVSQTNQAFEVIKNDISNGYRLNGAEISTISESDASFLGYIKQNKQKKLKKNGKYLIIDSGKGTTDFSIINLNDANKQEINSVFRSGFIGAGNVISYAFIDTIFAAIFGNNKSIRQKAIYDIVLRPDTDIADKINFVEAIEYLKQNFNNPKNRTNYQKLEQKIGNRRNDIQKLYSINPFDTSILNQITDTIKTFYYSNDQNSIQDEFGFIDNAVIELTNRIIKEVDYSGHKPEEPFEVVLTGRAFLFQPFIEKLRKHYPNIISVGLSEMKKICLEGAFSKRVINYDSNLVGKPQLKTTFIDEEGLEHLVIDNGGQQNKTILIDSRLPKSKFQEAYETIKELIKQQENFFKKFEYQDTDNQLENTKSKSVLKFLDVGEVMTNYSTRDANLLINGIVYNPSTSVVDTREINIYFDGKYFLLRTEKTVAELRIQPEFFKYDQFVFETLFPYTEVDVTQVKVDDSIDEDEII